MVGIQDAKQIPLFVGTQTTSATASAMVDTLGFMYCTFEAIIPAAAATNSSAKLTTFKLTESDATVYSNATAIVKFTGTTSATDATNGFQISGVNNNTTFPQTNVLLNVDCRARKRFLFATWTPGASNSPLCIAAIGSRNEELPSTDTKRNVGVSVVG